MRNIFYRLPLTAMILVTFTMQVETTPSNPIHDDNNARTNNTDVPDMLQTPFELAGDHGGLIFFDVRLNGENSRFVLDTGAPALILNSAHFPGEADTSLGTASGVSGPLEMRSITIDSLDWHGLELQNTDVIGVDLAHLETATGSELSGLIGYETVKDFELLIDYPSRQLTLFRPDATNFHKDVRPQAVIPFTLEAHIPVLDVEIGGQPFRLGIDTGAAVNLLDPTSFSQLEATTDYDAKGEDVLHGADKNVNTVQLFNVKTARVAGSDFGAMLTTVSDISHLNQGYGLEVDGLLGYPFLSQRRMSINFKDQNIYLWDSEVEITSVAPQP